MFCTQCGKECPEGYVFCTLCGNRLPVRTSETTVLFPNEPAPAVEPEWKEQPAVVAGAPIEKPVFEQPQTPAYPPQEPVCIPQESYDNYLFATSYPPVDSPAPVEKKKSKLPLIFGILAVIAVAAVALFFLCGNKAERLAVQYITALIEGDADTIEELSFDDWDVDGDDKVCEDVRLSDIEVIGMYEIPSDFDYFEDDFEEMSDELFDGEDVEQYYRVYMIVTVEYDEDEYLGQAYANVYQCDGEWYVRGLVNLEDDFYDEYDD